MLQGYFCGVTKANVLLTVGLLKGLTVNPTHTNTRSKLYTTQKIQICCSERQQLLYGNAAGDNPQTQKPRLVD